MGKKLRNEKANCGNCPYRTRSPRTNLGGVCVKSHPVAIAPTAISEAHNLPEEEYDFRGVRGYKLSNWIQVAEDEVCGEHPDFLIDEMHVDKPKEGGQGE